VVALIPVNAQNRLAGEPQFVSRGSVYLQDADDLPAGRDGSSASTNAVPTHCAAR
jgi:hypothetical protein